MKIGRKQGCELDKLFDSMHFSTKNLKQEGWISLSILERLRVSSLGKITWKHHGVCVIFRLGLCATDYHELDVSVKFWSWVPLGFWILTWHQDPYWEGILRWEISLRNLCFLLFWLFAGSWYSDCRIRYLLLIIFCILKIKEKRKKMIAWL